jgi:hypothetical protein
MLSMSAWPAPVALELQAKLDPPPSPPPSRSGLPLLLPLPPLLLLPLLLLLEPLLLPPLLLPLLLPPLLVSLPASVGFDGLEFEQAAAHARAVPETTESATEISFLDMNVHLSVRD